MLSDEKCKSCNVYNFLIYYIFKFGKNEYKLIVIRRGGNMCFFEKYLCFLCVMFKNKFMLGWVGFKINGMKDVSLWYDKI